MYGNGIGPASGAMVGTGGVLAATGTGGLVLPLVVVIIGLALGALLVLRGVLIRRRAAKA